MNLLACHDLQIEPVLQSVVQSGVSAPLAPFVALLMLLCLGQSFVRSVERGRSAWPVRIACVLAFVTICTLMTVAGRAFGAGR